MKNNGFLVWLVFLGALFFLWDAWQKDNAVDSLHSKTLVQSSVDSSVQPPLVQKDLDLSVPNIDLDAVKNNSPVERSTNQTLVSPETVRIKNDVLSLTIGLKGGQIEEAFLLEHKVRSANSSGKIDSDPFVLFNTVPESAYLAQVGWIGAFAEGKANFPTHNTKMSLVKSSGMSAVLITESGGMRLERTYVLAEGSYVLSVLDKVTNISSKPFLPTQYLQLSRTGNQPTGESNFFYKTFTGPVVYTDVDKFQKIDFQKIAEGKAVHTKESHDGWIGIIQHYFLSAWIPSGTNKRNFYTQKISEDFYSVGLKESFEELYPARDLLVESKLLIGPQDQRMLHSIAPGLDLSVDYGIFTVIAQPIYWLLEKLHFILGNWGWAIIFLTVIVKTIFLPFQAISFRSMQKMKAVTPRMNKIRELFADDKAKMNQAIMELYRSEKINPLGGCLPVLVQIPVFISLYWVLLASVEMRNTPWFGWIQDLSSPDPFYILPIIMAATMLIQVRLSPKPADPIQEKVMLFMPLVFSIMFFFFPSGLVLYWLVNNIYSIAQQAWMARGTST